MASHGRAGADLPRSLIGGSACVTTTPVVARYVRGPSTIAPGAADLLEPRRHVDRVTCNEEVAPLRRAAGRHHIAGIDADAHLEWRRAAVRRGTLVVVAPQGLAHVERGAHGADRIVFVGDGRAEDGHHGVADILLDGTAVAMDLARHRGEEAGQQRAHILGVEPLGERGRAGDVREEHGDDSPLLGAILAIVGDGGT